MNFHKLLIKTHNVTGLKYLCYTKKEDHEQYPGSGKYWKRHLKQHGYDVTTELIFQTEDYSEFKRIAAKKSKEYDVVNSNLWANLRIEEGDGGDTVSNMRWTTDGISDVYRNKEELLPVGWRFGRSNCIFNDSKKQKEFSKRSNREEAARKTKERWKNGTFVRDHSKCGVVGEKNPAKREEVKRKMSESWKGRDLSRYKDSAKKRTKIRCEHCTREFQPGNYATWHGDKCKNNVRHNDNKGK